MNSILMDTRIPIKTIFLDRDGVINKEVNYLHKIEDFIFIKGVFEACLHFQNAGYKIILVTNQSGIGRGIFTKNDFQRITDWMLKQFSDNKINILDIFYCPHTSNDKCNCRKPKPGMFFAARKEHNIDLNHSWMIGDKEDDIMAANEAGIKKTILVRSGHKINEGISNAEYIVNSIYDSINII